MAELKHIHIHVDTVDESRISDLELTTIIHENQNASDVCDRKCGETHCVRDCPIRLVVDGREYKL